MLPGLTLPSLNASQYFNDFVQYTALPLIIVRDYSFIWLFENRDWILFILCTINTYQNVLYIVGIEYFSSKIFIVIYHYNPDYWNFLKYKCFYFPVKKKWGDTAKQN